MAIGDLSASGVLYTDRRRFYLNENEVAELYMSETPFLSGLMGVGSEQVDDPDYKMFEYRAGWANPSFLVNDTSIGNFSGGSTTGAPGETITLTCDTFSGVSSDSSLIGAVVDLWNSAETTFRGTMVVTAVSGSNVTFKVLGNPTVAAQAISGVANDDVFRVRTTAAGEGVTSPDASTDELEVVWNSTQIIRTPLELTGTLAAANLRGQKERERYRVNKGREHMMKLERALFFGYRTGGIGGTANGAGGGTDSSFISHQTDANGKTIRTTMGVIPALLRYGRTSGDQQNVFTNYLNTYTFDDFADQMDKIAQYAPGGGEFVAYCGSFAYSAWSKLMADSTFFGTGQYNVEPMTTESGLHIKKLFTPSGIVINLVRAAALNYGGDKGRMVIVNPDNVKLVSYRPNLGDAGENGGGSYSSVAYNTNIKTDDGYDGIKDEYFSDAGVGLTLADSHALMTIGATAP